MNIYFLVEGRRTERKVYPKWLSYLVPKLSQVFSAQDAGENNFYVFSGNGYPSLLDNHLRNSIEEVNELKKYDYLVLCLDADDVDVEQRKNEVFDFIKSKNISLLDTEFKIIIQSKCIESWFLGNKKVFPKQPNNVDFIDFIRFYNVRENDPELMGKLDHYESLSTFHHDYLKEMLKERNVAYTKQNPRGVVEKTYLLELIRRTEETNHIETFREFIDFCEFVNNKL